MKFCSLDVETANHNQGSICQIGIGFFDKGKLTDTWQSYIDPRDYFHPRFIEIHGIGPKTVKCKPTFPMVYSHLNEILSNNIVVHHSPFDKTAFNKAYSQNGLEPIAIHWLDSVRVARHTWSEFSEGGYNLAHLAWQLDIQFKHHDALEDAVAAGKIVLAACRKSGLSVEDFHDLFYKP